MLTQAQFDFVAVSTAHLEQVNYEGKVSLFEAMDKVMAPLLKAAKTAEREQIEQWIAKLPLGYYRQSLRVVVIERFYEPTLQVFAPEAVATKKEKKAERVAPVFKAAQVVSDYAAAINAAMREEGLDGRD
jgi:hypothetical protein